MGRGARQTPKPVQVKTASDVDEQYNANKTRPGHILDQMGGPWRGHAAYQRRRLWTEQIHRETEGRTPEVYRGQGGQSREREGRQDEAGRGQICLRRN